MRGSAPSPIGATEDRTPSPPIALIGLASAILRIFSSSMAQELRAADVPDEVHAADRVVVVEVGRDAGRVLAEADGG